MQHADRLAGRYLVTYGVELEDDVTPTEQLMGMWRQAIVSARAIRALIAGTDPDLLLPGRTGPVLNPLVQLLDEREKTAFEFGAQLAKLGIEHRRLQIEEEDTGRLADAMLRVFTDSRVGMTVDQQQAARRVFAENLRSLDERQPLAIGGSHRPSLAT